MTKSLFTKTYGCQMNVYDSERMAELLAPLGYRPTDDPDGADMVILNTCHIREKAAEKVYSDLGRFRQLQDEKTRSGGRMLIAVAGCVAQAEGEEIIARAPQVDMIFGPQTYHRLPEMVVRTAREAGEKVVDTAFPVEDKFDILAGERQAPGISAFLTVQEGCDKFCSFCVVPYTRGAENSRPVEAVAAEAASLVAAGAREITLLGQNVNAYHGQKPDGRECGLGELVRRLAEIPGLERIRYTTSHPLDMDEELIAAHRDVPLLMPYLHLPVQSGSDAILKSMNRRHTADDYRRIVERLRTARADLALSSDFIVGFPGETDRDFAETLRLVTEIGFAGAFSFKYSPRPGTPAATDRQVQEQVKEERLAALQQLLAAQTDSFNRGCVGTVMPVLFDKPGRHEGQVGGRSPYLQAVHVEGSATLIGSVQPVRIAAALPHSLRGALDDREAVAPQALGHCA